LDKVPKHALAPVSLPGLTVIIVLPQESRGELNDFLARVAGRAVVLTPEGLGPERALFVRDLLDHSLLRGTAFGPASDVRRGVGGAVAAALDAPLPGPPGWRFLPNRRDVRRPDGRLCDLTTAEYEALSVLYVAHHAHVSRAELAERVFGRAYQPGDRAIDTLIHKLREKIGPEVIVTLRGRGYAFAEFPAH